MADSFWQGRKVLVTGHTGFKGSWLCLWLQRLGAEVYGLALDPPSSPSLFAAARVADGMHSSFGDVRNADAVQALIQGAEPEVVIHMAAQSLVRYSYREPVETFATNAQGTVHVLEAVRHTPSVRAVVVVTSDKCYENQERSEGYREDEPLGGHDPYSASKGCAEIITAAYRRSFLSAAADATHTVAVASARAGNVIGGGDWSDDRLIPDLVRAFVAGEPAVVRNPGATRPWQHVLDPLAGYLKLAERLVTDPHGFDRAWNFGPSDADARPVEFIAERLCARFGAGASWISTGEQGPHEATLLHLDSTNARSELGWSPILDLPTTLDRVAHWYREQLDGGDARDLTIAEIDQYQAERVAASTRA